MSPALGPRRDRAIRKPMMMRASTASKIHSQRSDDPEPLLAAVDSGLAAAAGLCPAGRLGRVTLGTALLMVLLMVPPQPVTSAAPVKEVLTTSSGRRVSIRASRASVSRSALVSGGWVSERGHRR